MKRNFYFLAFVLLLASVYVPAQTWEIGGNGAARPAQNSKNPGPAEGAKDGKGRHKASISDDDLKQQVNQKFGANATWRNIQVEVQNRTVVLSGTVPTRADRKRASRLAKTVAGVRRVKDYLTVDANATSSGSNEPTYAGNAAHTHSASGSTIARRRSASRAPRVAARKQNSTASASAPAIGGPASGANGTSGTTSATTGGISGAAASAAANQSGSTATTNGSIASSPSNSPAASSAKPRDLSASETPSTIPGMRPEINTDTLKGQIENAIRNDPTMAGTNVGVNVGPDIIELSGNVPSGKQKTTAWRIAQSYAFDKHIQDKIVVLRPGRNNPGTSQVASPAGNANAPKSGPPH